MIEPKISPPPTDDEHQTMALFGSPKRSKKTNTTRIVVSREDTQQNLARYTTETVNHLCSPPPYAIYIQISNTQYQWDFVCDPYPYVGRISTQDIDIALLQDVINHNLNSIRRYTAHINQGTEGRGSAIMTKVGLSTSNIKRLPSGSGMAAIFNGTWLINIYVPSGAEKKTKRERFYTNNLTYYYRLNTLK
jgi:hypothetical protein